LRTPSPPLQGAARVASPCIGICRIDPQTRLCEGCLRTLDEIAAWGTLDDDARRDVWRAIRRRAAGTEEDAN
jgi:uncharacterized protein